MFTIEFIFIVSYTNDGSSMSYSNFQVRYSLILEKYAILFISIANYNFLIFRRIPIAHFHHSDFQIIGNLKMQNSTKST